MDDEQKKILAALNLEPLRAP